MYKGGDGIFHVSSSFCQLLGECGGEREGGERGRERAERERERERGRERERERERETDRQTERKRETERQKEKERKKERKKIPVTVSSYFGSTVRAREGPTVGVGGGANRREELILSAHRWKHLSISSGKRTRR